METPQTQPIAENLDASDRRESFASSYLSRSISFPTKPPEHQERAQPPPPAAEEPLAPVKAAPPVPLPGWTPAKVKGGVWGARFQGDTRTLPADLDGRTISVTASSGDSWNATITEVVERSPDRTLVQTRRLDR